MTAYVLMTGLPITKGHFALISFAAQVDEEIFVIISTQPDEPFIEERVNTLVSAGLNTIWISEELPQDPNTPGFQKLWCDLLREHGVKPGDYIVASESYGIWLAEGLDATFIPYDPERTVIPCKATDVRNDPIGSFHLIAHEFQQYLKTKVVIFGAESTGKTTLAKGLPYRLTGHFFFEWARPYLEMVGPEITIESMTNIWKGQLALERHADFIYDKPYHIFDTDLYSTIGYWSLPHWKDTLGDVPEQLIKDATKSDLYIITQSNIPFEQDPLRYGGDVREASDEYWIGIAEQYELNYVVLESSDLHERYEEAISYIEEISDVKASKLWYDRKGF